MSKRFECPICFKRFKTGRALDEHFKEEHVGRPTEEGVKYALSVGISPEQLIKHGYPEELVKRVVRHNTKVNEDVYEE